MPSSADRKRRYCWWQMVKPPGRAERRDTLKFFRTGIDDLPEIAAVLDLLHFGGETAVAPDPFLHRVRIIGHQIRSAFRTRHLDAEGKGLVVIGLVEAEARLRRH